MRFGCDEETNAYAVVFVVCFVTLVLLFILTIHEHPHITHNQKNGRRVQP